MTRSRVWKSVGAAGACAAVGVIAGIASSAAAPGNLPRYPTLRAATVTAGMARMVSAGIAGSGGAFLFKLGGPAVHSVAIVPNRAGDGFDTVTQDSGTVKSVSGESLTITESTDKATYATPTLTIRADATVERNFETAKLADLQPGDHVDVTSTAGGSENVSAADSQHWPPKPPQFPTKVGPVPPPVGGPGRPAGVAFGYSVGP